MKAFNDLTAVSRAKLQALLDGTATEETRRIMQGAVTTPIQHNPLECPVCIHEIATGIPPLIEVRFDPYTGSIFVTTDDGPTQGERCGELLQREFDKYPQAREYARRIAGAIGSIKPEYFRDLVIALAGALHHAVTIAHEDNTP